MIKTPILQGDITILFNDRVSKYISQKLMELHREVDESTILVGDFNTPLSVTDRSNR